LCGGANRHKLITSFTETKVVTTSFKARQPLKLSPLVTTGLLGVNRHFQCNSTRSLISARAELLLRYYASGQINKQRDGHTDTVIAILRTPTGGEVKYWRKNIGKQIDA